MKDFYTEVEEWAPIEEGYDIDSVIEENPDVRGFIDDINDILDKIGRAYKQDKMQRNIILKQIEDNLRTYK